MAVSGNGGIIGPSSAISLGGNTVTDITSSGCHTTRAGTTRIQVAIISGGGGGRSADPGIGGGGRVGFSSSSDMLRTTVPTLNLRSPLTYAALVLPPQHSWWSINR